jgi:predicted transcriptional regulator
MTQPRPSTGPESNRENLRLARLRACLSLGPAAELLELNRKRLGDLEHGRTDASAEEWHRIFGKLEDAADARDA